GGGCWGARRTARQVRVTQQLSGVGHPVIGVLYTVLAAEYGFRRGLSESGFVEGQNLAIDYRSTAGQFDRLPEMAADLAGRNVAVIISIDSDPPPGRQWRRPRLSQSSSQPPEIPSNLGSSPVGTGPEETSPGSQRSAKSSCQSGWSWCERFFLPRPRSPCC